MSDTFNAWAGSSIHALSGRIERAEERIRVLEHAQRPPQHPLDIFAAAQSQAAQQQATEHLYAPLRSDTRAVIELAAFARRLIDMQDLGYAVSEEVRVLAKRALGV